MTPRESQRYLISVLRDPNSRGGSSALHDLVLEGDKIMISEPKNHFPLVPGSHRNVLIAGGIGVTPILCMAERLANIGAEFEMHYCARSPDRTAFGSRIAQSAFADQVSFHFDDGPIEQRFDLPALLGRHDAQTHVYVCGPRGFLDFVVSACRQNGWANDRIHFEYFSADIQKSAADVAFDVRLSSMGKVYPVRADQTVVAALAEQGVEIPLSCGEGVCGTCVTGLVEGEPDHRDHYLTPTERAQCDHFVPCCSRAKSGLLVLDL